VRGALPAAPLVLDYIDALSEAARLAAARETSAVLRAYWRFEAPRLARIEASAGAAASLRLATTPLDARRFRPGRAPAQRGRHRRCA